ncbi:MAG: hypothetical protein ACI4JT_07355 [Oscillospiraceae bacterium]
MTFEELYNGYYSKVLRYLCSHTDNVQDAKDALMMLQISLGLI